MEKNDLCVYEYRMQKQEKYAELTRKIRKEDTSKKYSIRTSEDFVDIYIYYPDEITNEVVYFNFHGGGFVLGNYELDIPYCKMISERTGCVVINVDYLLAPEYKFPLPYTTAFETIKWCNDNSNSLNISNKMFIVGGSSAGGNLAAGLVHLNQKEKANIPIRGLVMNYPPCSQVLPSEEESKSSSLKRERLFEYFNWFFHNGENATNPLASPVFDNVTKYPPTLMNIAELDSLRFSAEEFKNKLKTAGVEVDYKLFIGAKHGFTHADLSEFNSELSEEAWDRICRFILQIGGNK